MDIRKRIYGPLAVTDGTRVVGLDLSEFLRRLLLFEGVVLYSRFSELGMLARTRGLDVTLDLLQAPGFQLVFDPSTIAKISAHSVGRSSAGMLRVSRLDFGIIRPGSADQWRDRSFADLRKESGLTPGRANKLENIIRGRLKPLDPDARQTAFEQTKADLLTVAPSVRAAIDVALRKHSVKLPPPGDYSLEVQFASTGYVVETDIHRILKLSDDDAAAAIATGMLGAAGLNCALDDMRLHNALVGLQDSEFPVFEAKLDFLSRQLDPAEQAARLERVVALLDLPSITDTEQIESIDVHRLLEVRQSEECRVFRDWLWSSGSVTDEEIREQFQGLRHKLGGLVRSNPGKGLRWAASAGLGFLPVIGPAIGIAAGLIDTFVTERVLPGRGALAFLGAEYKSIFDG
jgi:hypothetical protein